MSKDSTKSTNSNRSTGSKKSTNSIQKVLDSLLSARPPITKPTSTTIADTTSVPKGAKQYLLYYYLGSVRVRPVGLFTGVMAQSSKRIVPYPLRRSNGSIYWAPLDRVEHAATYDYRLLKQVDISARHSLAQIEIYTLAPDAQVFVFGEAARGFRFKGSAAMTSRVTLTGRLYLAHWMADGLAETCLDANECRIELQSGIINVYLCDCRDLVLLFGEEARYQVHSDGQDRGTSVQALMKRSQKDLSTRAEPPPPAPTQTSTNSTSAASSGQTSTGAGSTKTAAPLPAQPLVQCYKTGCLPPGPKRPCYCRKLNIKLPPPYHPEASTGGAQDTSTAAEPSGGGDSEQIKFTQTPARPPSIGVSTGGNTVAETPTRNRDNLSKLKNDIQQSRTRLLRSRSSMTTGLSSSSNGSSGNSSNGNNGATRDNLTLSLEVDCLLAKVSAMMRMLAALIEEHTAGDAEDEDAEGEDATPGGRTLMRQESTRLYEQLERQLAGLERCREHITVEEFDQHADELISLANRVDELLERFNLS